MENQEQKNEEIKKYSVEDIIKIFNENKGSENNMPEDILKLINTFSTPMKKDEKITCLHQNIWNIWKVLH